MSNQGIDMGGDRGEGDKKPAHWILTFGAICAAATLLFFMALVVSAIFDFSVPDDARFLVVVVLALSAAISAAFLGGVAAVSGKIPFPFVRENPLAVSATGGIAVLVIILIFGYYLYIKPGLDGARQHAIIAVPVEIPSDFTIINKSPEAIDDLGEIRTIGHRRYLYVQFRTAQKASGKIQLRFPNGASEEFEEPLYEVTGKGTIKRVSSS